MENPESETAEAAEGRMGTAESKLLIRASAVHLSEVTIRLSSTGPLARGAAGRRGVWVPEGTSAPEVER
jgi:hypothetical protein